jgi:hypothetical protein
MKKIVLFILVFFALLPIYQPVYAVSDSCPTGSVCLNNPLGETDPNILIGKVIRAVLGLVGSLALVMFIYGGFTWMTAAGSSEKVTKGKNIIIWATIGLIVIFSAYALVKFVLTGLGV